MAEVVLPRDVAEKALADLYPVISRQDGALAEELADTEWGEAPDVRRVLRDMLDRFEAFLPGHLTCQAKWAGGQGEFVLVVKSQCAGPINDYTLYWTPLSFLDRLDDELKNLAWDVLACVNRSKPIMSWEDHDWVGDHLTYSLEAEGDDPDNEYVQAYQADLAEYEALPSFIAMLKGRGKHTPKSLAGRIKRLLKARTLEHEAAVLEWLSKGLALLDAPLTLWQVQERLAEIQGFDPDDEGPAGIDRYFNFMWETEDIVWRLVEEELQNISNNYGEQEAVFGCVLSASDPRKLSDMIALYAPVEETLRLHAEFFMAAADIPTLVPHAETDQDRLQEAA